VLILTALLTLTASRQETVERMEPVGKMPRYSLGEVTHYQYRNATLRLEVSFSHGDYFDDSGELHVENCSFVYYDEFGETQSRGSSQKAVLLEDESRLIAEDDVIVVSEVNGGVLTTEYLVWEDDRFNTDQAVTITRENGDIIQGVGMAADVALNVVTIFRDVRGSVRTE
jgi:LPS export ABC transporter protein LptC